MQKCEHFLLTDSDHKRIFTLNMLNILLDLGIKVNLTGMRSAGISFEMVVNKQEC